MTDDEGDICRVCRGPGAADRPLFRPCICAGSIRHVHQDCLTQWLRHSRKDYCELCNHRYRFKPIYSPDMPSRLPFRDLFMGLTRSVWSAVRCWIHYTVVAVAWLVIVPLAAARIFNCIFSGSVQVFLSLPVNLVSTKNIASDIAIGVCVLACTFCLFMCLIYLRMQILNGDVPEWLLLLRLPPQDDDDERLAANVDNNNNDEDNLGAAELVVNDGDEAAAVEDNAEIDNENLEDAAANNEAIEEDPAANNEAMEEDPLDNVLNWNAIDWERGPDEPTWERILGLDGSLQFVEHIFWVVALNTLFVLLFAFCPFHLGYLFLMWLDVRDFVAATKLEGIVTTICGYFLLALMFLAGHTVFKVSPLCYAARACGLCYLVLKVGLLIFVDLGVFPLACGVWLDVCTLKMFNATLSERKANFLTHPFFSLTFHYVIGIVFVFYFATFIILLRSCVRPGVMWFYRNLGNPDFSPVREIIHLPISKHVKRFALSIIIFGSTIILIAWLPVQLLLYLVPEFLPYHGDSDLANSAGDYPLQLMVFQFALPGLLEQGSLKNSLRRGIQLWCKVVSKLLGIRSYLLGDQDDLDQDRDDWYDRYVPYTRPTFFVIRVLLLLALGFLSVVAIAAIVMYFPVRMGRIFFALMFGSKGALPLVTEKQTKNTYELYTLAIGVWLCWLCLRLCGIVSRLVPDGWSKLRNFLSEMLTTVWKSLALAVFIVGILPLQLGLLFDLVAVVPLRVPLHQTPVIFIWQDWALGIFLFKMISVTVLMGPDNWVKRNVEAAYHQGFQRLDVWKFIRENLLVVAKWLLVVLAIPYVAGHGLPLLFDCDVTVRYLFRWRSYPTMICGAAVAAFCYYEVKQFGRLCDRIKNERYMIGKTLVDYEGEKTSVQG